MVKLIRYPRHGAIRLLLGRHDLTLSWRWGWTLAGGGPIRYFILAPSRRRWEWGWTRGPGEAGYRGRP